VRQIVLLPDGKGFVSSSGWPNGDGTIRVWDYVTGKTVRVLRGHDGNIDALAVTADGKVIVSGGQDGTIRTWDTATGREIWRAAAHTQVVTSVDISPDGKHLASSGREGTIKLSDISTGKAIRQWKAHPSICRYVRYTPDGKRLVSCGYDGTVRTWNPETGQQLKSFAVRREGPKPVPVSRLAITPDGKTLLTADAAVGVWDLDTGKELRTIRGFAGPTNVSVSPDGRRFAVCGYDGRVRLYDLGDGALRQVLPAVPGWSWAATFAADGKTLLTGGGTPQNPHEVPPGVYTIKMWSIDNSGERR
jgi:WD40 repeat protein